MLEGQYGCRPLLVFDGQRHPMKEKKHARALRVKTPRGDWAAREKLDQIIKRGDGKEMEEADKAC